jgi:predicted RNase H-like nuclease (RuvC/YqgF family)
MCIRDRLERVRDRERELAAAKALAASREERIRELERELGATQARATRLSEQVDNLTQAHDQLMTAQQELAARGKSIATLTQQLDALALARLQAERLYFLLAKSVMELNPGQPQDVVDLQQRTRTQARDLDAAPSEQP